MFTVVINDLEEKIKNLLNEAVAAGIPAGLIITVVESELESALQKINRLTSVK